MISVFVTGLLFLGLLVYYLFNRFLDYLLRIRVVVKVGVKC